MGTASAVRSVAAAILVLSAAAAGAADEPEAVYRKLHGATLAGKVDEMLLYATAAQRAEISAMPDRITAVKFLANMMPRAYAVTGKSVAPDGKTAQVLATGAHLFMGTTQAMYGEINFVKEKDGWKVDQWGWSNTRPKAAAQAPRPAGEASAAGSTKPKAPAPMTRGKEPTLRRVETRAECVIKPVMTDEELERCRAVGR